MKERGGSGNGIVEVVEWGGEELRRGSALGGDEEVGKVGDDGDAE